METQCVFCEGWTEFLDVFRLALCVLAVSWLRRLVVGLSSRRPGFDLGSFHVRFVVDELDLGQVFVRVLPSSPLSITQPMLHTDMLLLLEGQTGTFKLQCCLGNFLALHRTVFWLLCIFRQLSCVNQTWRCVYVLLDSARCWRYRFGLYTTFREALLIIILTFFMF